MSDTCSYICNSCRTLIASDVSADPSRELFCLTCKTEAQKHFQVQLSFGSKILASMFAKHKRPGFKKPLLELKHAWNWSSDGVPAEIIQVIDRIGKRYKKWVRRADGNVVKDVEGPLSDQSLHGKPK